MEKEVSTNNEVPCDIEDGEVQFSQDGDDAVSVISDRDFPPPLPFTTVQRKSRGKSKGKDTSRGSKRGPEVESPSRRHPFSQC